MKDGFVKVGAATPSTRVADIAYNGEQIVKCCFDAAGNDCSLLVFPELCITGYTCGDLFLQETFLESAYNELYSIVESTSDLNMVIVVGLPLAFRDKLYNVAAVCYSGNVLGFVPKMNIPAYSEFYELRHFSPYDGLDCVYDEIPFGNILFRCASEPDFCFGVEICEDLWVPRAPSVELCISGAKIICNLSASDEVIGKGEYRRKLVSMQSATLVCGYIYADAGFGESTQDLIFAGHNLICENGNILSESKKYASDVIYSEIDLKRLAYERHRMNTFTTESGVEFEEVIFDQEPAYDVELTRSFPQKPFVPSSRDNLRERCEEILRMQATGLATRLKHINCSDVIVGLSGGLDSTLALIVCVHAFDMLSFNRKGIHTVTMPCFGTTDGTKSNSLKLAEHYGVSMTEIPIYDSVKQHFKDISHDEQIHNTTYENSQARERTQILMDLANKNNGIVVGTGDLSELALGWATYNGDHMSMYGVNGSIPKTLVRYLVSYEAERVSDSNSELSNVLIDVVHTPVSPELLPPTDNGKISQKTEDLVGPYELHDFFLYYFVRFAYSPSKIFRIAKLTFEGVYDEKTIYKWEETFIRRFFTQQFKRSCLPDGPKVGTVTLSPRGDWRMPSDASADVWLRDLESVKPED